MSLEMETVPVEAVDTEDPAIEVIPSPQFEEDEELAEHPFRASVMAGCELLVWVLVCPFLALLSALNGAYAAERNKGPLGKSCKTVGHIAVSAEKKARAIILLVQQKQQPDPSLKDVTFTDDAKHPITIFV